MKEVVDRLLRPISIIDDQAEPHFPHSFLHLLEGIGGLFCENDCWLQVASDVFADEVIGIVVSGDDSDGWVHICDVDEALG